MVTAWSLPGRTSRPRGSREVSSALACFRGFVGQGMWGFLPQEADKVAHPGDWVLPKIHPPETGLRSILGWLHNKTERRRKRIVCLSACIRRSLAFAQGLVLLCFGICHVLASSGTLELILMGTSSQGTAKGTGQAHRQQGREHQGKCSVQCPSFCQAAANAGLWLRAASRESI